MVFLGWVNTQAMKSAAFRPVVVSFFVIFRTFGLRVRLGLPGLVGHISLHHLMCAPNEQIITSSRYLRQLE